MDLSFCNGHERYDFSTDEGFYYPGYDPKDYHIKDLSQQAFRREYIAALFAEDQCWLTAIEKYQLLVPGSAKNSRDKARDLAVKEFLAEQVSSDTLEDRKAFFEVWKDASCCADTCERNCDEYSNKNIQFKSVPTFGFDADVRRYITKYWRYKTTSELKEDSNVRTVLSRVCDRKSDNDFVRVREQKRGGLSGQPEEVASDQAERIEAMFSHPLSEEMVT